MATAIHNRLRRPSASPLLPFLGESAEVQAAATLLESKGYGVHGGPGRRSFTGFLYAIQKNDRHTLEKVYGSTYQSGPTAGVVKAAMGESSGAVGGYVVPLDYTAKLLEPLSEDSFIFPRANVIPMESRETLAPKIDAETTQSAGTSPFFGGIKFLWGSEQAASETEPAFRTDNLKCWDLLGYAVVSNQFLMDIGPTGESYLLNLFGKAAAWYAEYAFLQGTGAAQLMPLGVLNAPATITVSRGTPSQISATDIAAMAAKLLPYSWKNAIWAASPTCLAQIIKISSFFLNVEGHPEGGQAGSLVTRPLFITEKLASLGTQGDLLLFDPSLYVIGLRQEVLIDVSEHTSFPSYQTNFRIWLRLTGLPQVSKAITLQDGSSTVSPYVVLL